VYEKRKAKQHLV